MKKKKLMNSVIMLFAFLLATSTSFAQTKTEEDMAKAVFETIKKSDSEAFSFYCISEKRMTKVLNGLVDTTHVVKSVKQDLVGINPQKTKYAVIAKFDKLLDAVKKENLDISKATFEGVVLNKIGMDIPNLMSKKVKFKISIDKVIYIVRIDLFIANNDMFIYDFSFVKEE